MTLDSFLQEYDRRLNDPKYPASRKDWLRRMRAPLFTLAVGDPDLVEKTLVPLLLERGLIDAAEAASILGKL